MTRYVLTLEPDGTVRGLYDDRLPYRDLGRLRVARASVVEFDEDRQEWVARDARGREVAAAPTREECLRREVAALQEDR